MPASTAARKAALRAELRARLAALGRDEARRAGELVAARALALPELAAARRILACLSFGDELPTGPLVDQLLAEGRELFVPRADPADGLLHVHRYPCALVTLDFGLRQPPRDAPAVAREEIDATLDAALVLGLGFDRRGFRLGHGRGYFDRFLADRQLPAIGLAFDAQVVDALPVAPHDVPMSVVVTESRTLRREARGPVSGSRTGI